MKKILQNIALALICVIALVSFGYISLTFIGGGDVLSPFVGTEAVTDITETTVKEAVASPLLETTIAGASHVIINISGDITLMDASDAAEYVQDLAGEEANIIFGAMYDDTKTDEVTVTVIATGLDTPHPAGGRDMFNRTSVSAIRSGLQTNVVKPATTPVTPVQKPIFTGIQKPADIKSKVEENSLQIPSFLQKK
mgnify:CR=1 FL=1